MPLPISDILNLTQTGLAEMAKARDIASDLAWEKQASIMGSPFQTDIGTQGIISSKPGRSAADTYNLLRLKESAGANAMMSVFADPDSTEQLLKNVGTNYGSYLLKGAATGGVNAIKKDAGLMEDVNPWGSMKKKKRKEYIPEQGPQSYSIRTHTYEYEAPTGTYTQGTGLGDKPEYENTQKYGFNEGQLQSGKGKVSIMPNTGGKAQDLFTGTEEGRR